MWLLSLLRWNWSVKEVLKKSILSCRIFEDLFFWCCFPFEFFSWKLGHRLTLNFILCQILFKYCAPNNGCRIFNLYFVSPPPPLYLISICLPKKRKLIMTCGYFWLLNLFFLEEFLAIGSRHSNNFLRPNFTYIKIIHGVHKKT